MPNQTKLLTKVKEFLLRLSEGTCLVSFYIGKSEDVAMRELQHQEEGFCKSVEIAYSSSSAKIDKAERFLIDSFKKIEMPIAFDNKNDGGGGNPQANKLYVSLRLKMKSDSDLWDDEDDNFIFKSIEL